MYIYMYIYIYLYIFIYICILTYIYSHIYLDIQVYRNALIYVFICIHPLSTYYRLHKAQNKLSNTYCRIATQIQNKKSVKTARYTI